MPGLMIFAQSSSGSIADLLVPWLARALIIVCLWCTVEPTIVQEMRNDKHE